MKIIVFMGSPRKEGNTDILTQAFVSGAKENNEVEVINVYEKNIFPCRGCNACFSKNGNYCAMQDDVNEIYDKLKQADMVVVASPVYFYGVSAQLKALIDRLHSPIRNEFKIKQLGILLVGAANLENLFKPILEQYEMILKFFGLQSSFEICCRQVRERGDILGNPVLIEAYQAGKSIK